MTLTLIDALRQARLLLRGAKIELDERPAALDAAEALDRSIALLDGSGGSEAAPGGAEALLARERDARLSAEVAQRRMQFMYEATRILFASPLEVDLRLKKIAALAVPDLADWCIVDRREGALGVRRVAVRTWNPEKSELASSLEGTWTLDPEASFGASEVIRSGRPELRETRAVRVPRTEQEQAFEQLLDAVGGKSQMTVPLTVGPTTTGAITFIFAESSRRYGDADLALAGDLAGRVAFAVDNARLFEALEHTVRAREEMVAMVSHDLRNPLSSIRMSGEILKGKVGPLEAKKVEIILRQATRMEQLLSDLLDVTTIEAGGLALQRTTERLDGLVSDALDLLRPIAETKGVNLSATVSRPGLTLLCDRDRMLQVFSNLVGNAIKFTAEGGSVTITATDAGPSVKFEVTDTGVGIPTDDLAHVFDRFWQGSRKRAAGGAGAGLGLSIVRGIVERHGGRVWATSVPGTGTTFHLTLPKT